MKKLIFTLIPALLMMAATSCSNKVYTADTANAEANPADFIPFSKNMKYRLDQDRADLRKIQFYIDQTIVLRNTASAGGGAIKNGTVMYDNSQQVTEFTIPAYTPGVCERVKGDSLYISFDAPQNSFVFAALYENEHFMLQGTNWYNGVTDVKYDNKIFKAQCEKCGSAGEAKLVIRRSQAGSGIKPVPTGGKVLAGRKLR